MSSANLPWPLAAGAGLKASLMVAAMALLAVALPATAQVYKCADKAGRITYQQQPCPVSQKGARMDLQLNNGTVQDGGADGDWAARAARKEVVVGMPRAFVVKAQGTPQEMRPGRPQENAAEVWRYRRKDFDLGVGFNKGVVAWIKDNPSDAPAAAPDPEPSRRQNFHVTRKCADIAAEAGAPASVYEEMDEGMARRVMRHVWEPEPGDRERTIVTCVDGAIARVERIPGQ